MAKKKTSDSNINYDDAAKLIHIWFSQLIISIIRGCIYILTAENKDDKKMDTWSNYLDGLELTANTPYEDLSEDRKEALIELVKDLVSMVKI